VAIAFFILVAIVSAALWHRGTPRYLLACTGAAITSTILFQVAAYLQQGYLDAFFLIAALVSLVLSFAVSLLIGLPVRARRARESANRAA